VGQLIIGCSGRLGYWSTVTDLAKSKSDLLWDSNFVLFESTLASYESGDVIKARDSASRLQVVAHSRLSIDTKDGDAGYYLAFSNRILGSKPEAYKALRECLPGNIDSFRYVLALMRADPSLDVFAKDEEFQNLMAEFEQKNRETRNRIHEVEKSLGQ
jgi:hypothetical protein